MDARINATMAASKAEPAAVANSRPGKIPVLGQPAMLLRIEGLVLLAGSLLLYAENRGEWLAFLALLLAPDLSMLGYLRGPVVGGALYNLFHNYLPPAALLAFGVFTGSQAPVSLALIWLAHIGMDRLLGYGLKYPGGFKDTHVGRS
jgi:hypothetical protein